MKPNYVRSEKGINKTNKPLLPKGILLPVLFFVCWQTKIAAQTVPLMQTKSITPYSITITYNKTSNLIFPYAIKSVDRGNAAVLVQKAKGVDNILQVKAGRQGFNQTNLTVVTADGQFYSFLVDYALTPAALNLSFAKDSLTDTLNNTAGPKALLSDGPLDEAVFNTIADQINQQEGFLHLHSREQKMRLSLQSIWLKDKAMWLALQLENKSLIDYIPDYVRFFVRDKKRAKRTAVQETEIIPLYASADTVVTGEQLRNSVFAFTPFTIPPTQELVMQVGERNGGRSLLLHVNHRALLKARLLK